MKLLNLERPLAIIDLESTGTDPANDRIIEISILKVSPGADPDHRTRRVNPGVPIPPESTLIHQIRDEDVKDKAPFRSISQGIIQFLEGCDLCGFNLLRFDLPMLLCEFQRAGLTFPLEGRRLIDPCRIFHLRESRNLSAAVRFYCGREHVEAHSAEADALATLAVLEAQLERYPDLPRSVPELEQVSRDPKMVDLGGMFVRSVGGEVEFARGKHKGQLLSDIARNKPDYLEWILRSDFFDDTKTLAKQALLGARQT